MAKATTVFTITVHNFEKHNKDRRPSYKKVFLTNNFFNDSKVSCLTCTEKLLFIFLITQCGDQAKSIVSLTDVHLMFALGQGVDVHKSLRRLEELQLVTVQKTLLNRIEENRIEEKGIRQNIKRSKQPSKPETEGVAVAAPGVFDFESVYQLYPRKEGKADGMEVLKKTILTQAQFDELTKAVNNYADDCRLTNKEKRYIRHWSSFIGPASKPFWRDWIDWTPPLVNGKPKHVTNLTKTYDNLDRLEEEWAAKGAK